MNQVTEILLLVQEREITDDWFYCCDRIFIDLLRKIVQTGAVLVTDLIKVFRSSSAQPEQTQTASVCFKGRGTESVWYWDWNWTTAPLMMIHVHVSNNQ